MPRPNIFISHRWDYNENYFRLVNKFNEYGFSHLNYSVPDHKPLDAHRVKEIKEALRRKIGHCNYFIITARMACYSRWCEFEVNVAQEYNKPILSFRPYNYQGRIPTFITEADNQGGPVGFNTPAIIRKICRALHWPEPQGM